ncbi:hypothetical protein LOS88_14040 [Aeromonas veronii]|uniref:hypothetical protein n=1 Tax=Aeromonas veronii TaxID=654 RepID=UPI001FD68283|nr:hypothetical protein [Aeromonas veronii]UOR17342.1 hypothetical protein LOS88_14040 [Aeromonas veronii]
MSTLQGRPDASIPAGLFTGVDHDNLQVIQVCKLEEGTGPGWRTTTIPGTNSSLEYRCHCISLRLLSLVSLRIPAKLNSHSGQREHPDP